MPTFFHRVSRYASLNRDRAAVKRKLPAALPAREEDGEPSGEPAAQEEGDGVSPRLGDDVGRRALQHDDVRCGGGHRRHEGDLYDNVPPN